MPSGPFISRSFHSVKMIYSTHDFHSQQFTFRILGGGVDKYHVVEWFKVYFWKAKRICC